MARFTLRVGYLWALAAQVVAVYGLLLRPAVPEENGLRAAIQMGHIVQLSLSMIASVALVAVGGDICVRYLAVRVLRRGTAGERLPAWVAARAAFLKKAGSQEVAVRETKLIRWSLIVYGFTVLAALLLLAVGRFIIEPTESPHFNTNAVFFVTIIMVGVVIFGAGVKLVLCVLQWQDYKRGRRSLG